MASYTVKLLSLKCITAQEKDGDEINLEFNEQNVWHSSDLKFHENPTEPNMIDEIDFASGQVHGSSGWTPISSFNADDYVFANLEGSTYFELWEEDPLMFDDYLGKSPVSADDAQGGKISIAFARDGANYIVSYEVTM